MIAAATLAGWGTAVATGALAAGARRSLMRRTEAIASACHELRGPLTAVQLGLALAARPGELSAARLRAIELELGRAELALDELAGAPARRAASARAEQVDVARLLADSVEAWRASAAARGVRLQLTWSGARARVRGERPRLAQATGNLIANAIEHGAGMAAGRGGGVVEIRAVCIGSTVRIEVSDDGPGLPAPLPELMRPRRGRVRGRGLSIAAAAVAAHGGTLLAAGSTRGARLVIELPAA